MDTTTETTGQTLSGETLSPEEDPHDQELKDRWDENNSIYPIETTFSMKMSFDKPGKNPFYPNIAIEIPFGVDNIPTTRVKEAREDIKEKIDYSHLEIGELGTITFTEETHHIKFYSEDKKHTVTLGEWVFEQFYYFLEQADKSGFKHSDISYNDVSQIQDIVIENLPGKFITVGGECDFCESDVEETIYVSDPESTEAAASCNNDDCTKRTLYPEL